MVDLLDRVLLWQRKVVLKRQICYDGKRIFMDFEALQADDY